MARRSRRRFPTNGLPVDLFNRTKEFGEKKLGIKAEDGMATHLVDWFDSRATEYPDAVRVTLNRADYMDDQYNKTDYLIGLERGDKRKEYRVQFKVQEISTEDKIKHLKLGVVPVDMPKYKEYDWDDRCEVFLIKFKRYAKLLNEYRARLKMKKRDPLTREDIERVEQEISAAIDRYFSNKNKRLRQKVPRGYIFSPT